MEDQGDPQNLHELAVFDQNRLLSQAVGCVFIMQWILRSSLLWESNPLHGQAHDFVQAKQKRGCFLPKHLMMWADVWVVLDQSFYFAISDTVCTCKVEQLL